MDASLKKYKITNFDAATIYSIEQPIKQVHRNQTRFLTDAEALRNALAHNKYKITFGNETWKVEFDNNQEFGYHYKKEFTQKTFVDYLKTLEILYKTTFVLIYLQTLWGLASNLLIERRV